MVRFSASEDEIVALLRFLTRRASRGLRLVPLVASARDDLRMRRTTGPLAHRLAETAEPLFWGLRLVAPASGQTLCLSIKRLPESGLYLVDAEKSRLIVFQLGPACGPERRRDAVLEARDTDGEDDTLEHDLRDLVERCARRLRRRNGSRYENGRWYVPAKEAAAS